MALALGASTCGGDETTEKLSPPRPEPPLPTAPAMNDPAFAVSKLRSWYIIGNAATPSGPLSVEVTSPPDVQFIDLWIDGKYKGALEASGGASSISVDVAGLSPGAHEALLSNDSLTTAFARFSFTMTHPLYVITTTDWDDADNTDDVLARQAELHTSHPELKITHFVGPYTFTDPSVTPERRKALADWTISMRDTYGDEIGLHIHPYCNFVATTPVPCRTSPSLADAAGDDTGYSVVLSSYTEDEFVALLSAADALFMANGLGKPTSFRAGGWSAEANTLRALAKSGYVADTSALNWAKIEEWKGLPGAMLYEWNMQHWPMIDELSQPYYPNTDDASSSAAPTIDILEVPDNGALVDYVDAAEMIAVFEANWKNGALAEPRQVSVGYHPPNFSKLYKQRMDDLFTHVDQFLYAADKGPVIYTTLSPMALVWPPRS